MPSALFACTQPWQSCFQVGSHHIAREFARQGWRVGFVSAPISPLHLLGFGDQNRERIASWRSGGNVDPDTGIWHFVPFAPLPWATAPLLREERYVRLAWRLCGIGLKRVLQGAGFMNPEVGYTDHFLHEGLLNAAQPELTIFRRPDNLAAFPGAGADFSERELNFAQRANLTICTTPTSTHYFRQRGVTQTLTIPNGIQLDCFFNPAPLPDEYRGEQRPIIVYVGAAGKWLDIELILCAISQLKQFCWTVIGPFGGEQAQRLRKAGGKVLGPRPHDKLSAYLQHAHVGIVPFSLTQYRDLIQEVSPLKVFEYAACGLPVVGTRGCQYPNDLPTPLAICDNADEFLSAVYDFANQPKPPQPDPVQFAAYRWPTRLRPLFEHLKKLGYGGDR